MMATAQTTSPLIDVCDVRKTYRDGFLWGKRVEALRGVSLQVGRGEIFGLLGPNGAGKTTLIKILLGIVRKSAGEARLLGRPVGLAVSRRKIGYLPEGHRFPRHLTGRTALEYYGSLSGLSVSEIRRRRSDVLEIVGLGEWGRTSVRKYSKGMLQRLGLAQAMLHDPELLILDEPTDGVDPVGRKEMREVLKRLKAEGRTIFINSHLLQEIELVCDRVAILDHGQLRRVGKIAEITERAGTEVAFTLAGMPETVRNAVAEKEIVSCDHLADGQFQLIVKVVDQAAVDGWIDLLRAAGIGIHAMVRRRLTLEQAFLELVKEQQAAR